MRFRGVKVILRDGLEVTDQVRVDMFHAWQDLQLLHATQPGLQYKYMISGNMSWKVSSLNGVDRIELLGYEDKKKIPVPKPLYERRRKVQIFPYIHANPDFFGNGGLLVCLGGLDFSGEYELISPFGPEGRYSTMQYQPFGYVYVDEVYSFFDPWEYYGWWEHTHTHSENDVIVEYQVKKYYDPNRLILNEETGTTSPVLWDEIPWMGNYYSWDPVFYDNYADAFDSEGEYLYDKPYQFEVVYTANEHTDTKVIKETSDPFTAFNPWYWYGSFYLMRGEDNSNIQYNVMLGDNIVYTYYHVKTDIHQFSEGGPDDPDYPRWQDYYRAYGYPDLPEEENPFWLKIDQVIDSCSSVRSAVDQTDPSKYGLLYNHYYYERHYSIDANGPSPITLVDTEVTIWKTYFKGLGHEIKLFDEQYKGGVAFIRLYNINGKYICLFSIVSSSGIKLIGSVVEGGAANIIDITDGMLINGEVKQLHSGPAITLGMILRAEPEKVTRIY